MKKSFVVYLMVMVLLFASGCTRNIAQSELPVSSEPDKPLSADVAPSSSSEAAPSSAEEPVYTMEELFPSLPDTITIENDTLFDTENSVVMAELTIVEKIKSPDDPFAHYDQLYAEAVKMEEGEWGGCMGKWYWMQEEITGEAVGGFENHIVYCIQTGESMLVITFHPVQGVGGIGSQREAFEGILNTIQV